MIDLIAWKNKKNRKPLLIYGARQVGKTYLLKEFGKQEFLNTIYVNFETNEIVNNIIKSNIEPKNIVKELEVIYNQKIDPNTTLIIFDEIQENPRALTALKYFCEDAPLYYIVGAGSLLGVHIHRENYSFPVGKVDSMTIYPLNFEEFLFNTGNDLLIKEIKSSFESNKKLPATIHEKAILLYKDYLAIGGFPEVVNEYINTSSLISAIDIQGNILNSYRSDIRKYNSNTLSNKILATFDSIPNQLAKDNKKFQYKIIKKGGTSSIFNVSIDWLVNAGITNKCYKTNIGVPLKMYEEIESFKLYMSDTGLLTNMSKFPIYLIKNQDAVNDLMIGMLTENYVASCFIYNKLNLNYWQSDNTSEIDFVLQSKNGLIIPVEVKSSTHTKSKSLNNYILKYNPKYSIRISEKNFGFNNNIKSVPLYAVFCITDESLDK